MQQEKRPKINSFIIDIVLIFGSMGTMLAMAFSKYPLIYNSDCTSSISVAAKLAGYNWDNVVKNAGYYGFGYLFIFSPLFAAGVNPVIIYRVAAFVGAVLSGMTTVIAKKILDRNFSNIQEWQRFCIALITGCTVICCNANFSMRNEEPLVFMCFIVLYFIFELLDRYTRKNEIILLISLGYILTLHTRAIVIVLAVVFSNILCFYVKQKSFLKWYFWPLYLIEYSLISELIKLYQKSIWISDTRNTSIVSSTSNAISNLSIGMSQIKGFFMIFFGITYTQYSITAMVSMIAFISIINYLFHLHKFHIKDIRTLMYSNNPDKNNECVNVALVGFSFIVCWFIVSAGQAIIWLPKVSDQLASGTFSWISSYRAFTYTRYSGPFVPPIVFCGLVLLSIKPRFIKQAVKTASIIGVFLSVIFINMHVPYLLGRKNSYFLFPTLKNAVEIDNNVWMASIILTLSITFVVFFVVYLGRNNLFLMVLTAIIVISVNYQHYVSYTYNVKTTEMKDYAMSDAGWKLLSTIRDELTENGNTDIYVFDCMNRTDHQIYYMYQYMNYDLAVFPRLPESTTKEALLFVNGKPESKFLDDMYYAQLDDNEYVYCRGDDYIDILTNAGLVLEEYRSGVSDDED